MTTERELLGAEQAGSPLIDPAPPTAEIHPLPPWLRELETAVVASPQILVYGNVRDLFLIPDGRGRRFLGIRDTIGWMLRNIGFPALVSVDIVDGVRAWPDDEPTRAAAGRLLPVAVKLNGPCALGDLGTLLSGIARPAPARSGEAPHVGAVLVDYAARLVRGLPQLDGAEHLFFAGAERLSHTTAPLLWPDGIRRYNPVIWVVNHERELPGWFIAGNDSVRRIAVPMPELEERMAAAQALAPGIASAEITPDDQQAEISRFAEHTHGLTLRSMTEIVRLSRSRQAEIGGIEDAVRWYRVGILDNPWSKPGLRRRLTAAATILNERVLGQEQAIQHSVDILVRSVMGLSGAQAGTTVTKPRGVMFFAGPTGVGKTELAKSLSELIFGDESACIRFDMSEFSAAHAAERLVGAPPGYLGHDAGGELTNAVRERPFSLILFDEIEKADPSILDKFLQILDDGRLTDGSGSTVYFSEAVIVFTSNLGMTTTDERGVRVDNVTRDLGRAELERRLTDTIRGHFSTTLNRPELLNRIGDNIVVFNFIAEEVARRIFDLQLRRVCGRVERQHHVTVTVADDLVDRLRREATADLHFGGRGIGSFLETAFVNPLARALFEESQREQVLAPHQLVTHLDRVAGTWRLTLEPVW